MSTHNIGFYEEISKIITKLSSNTHLISFAGCNKLSEYLSACNVDSEGSDQNGQMPKLI